MSGSKVKQFFQVSFAVVVVSMALISFALSILQAVSRPGAKGIFILLGFSLFGFVAIATIVVYFVRSGGLPADKHWFQYAMGFAILLESTCTNVLLYQ